MRSERAYCVANAPLCLRQHEVMPGCRLRQVGGCAEQRNCGAGLCSIAKARKQGATPRGGFQPRQRKGPVEAGLLSLGICPARGGYADPQKVLVGPLKNF